MNSYYQCPHKPTCRNDQSIGKKPCRECVGMNRYQVRRHTAREDLHRACDPTCPVYNRDMESLKDYNFTPVAPVNLLRKSIESPPNEDENPHPGRVSRRTRTSTQQEGITNNRELTGIAAHRTTRRAATASPYVTDNNLTARSIQRAASTSPYMRDHNEHQPTTTSTCVNDAAEVINKPSSNNDTNQNHMSGNEEQSTAVSSFLGSKY
ncbi:hypothetical protein PGT21_002480 [Puccinia graminis f. sp. tritici]|uniref:Uncharacterized protein n=1 Tax=Puccinia graminis f. sp. tritici TaxID=56615 RepID=A0A5B0Q4N2_PUCGR|nr:hypothetical protein PGT21_002480 [Puccinia graminis f. sp. tritici]